MRNKYIVCYDIKNDKGRSKIEKIVRGYGQRIQYSVFICLLSRDELRELSKDLKQAFKSELFKKDNDSIYIFFNCDLCYNKIKQIGKKLEINEYYTII